MGVTPIDTKTPAGGEMVKVIFEDGSDETMPKVRFELLVTSEVSDASTCQKKIRARLGAMLYSTLHEYGIKVGEVNGISDAMVDLVNAGYKKAEEVLFGYETSEVPLLEINSILLKYNAEKATDGATSPGGEPDSVN